MEIKQIYDCQEVLDSVSKIKTEEELKCDQLLRNPNIIEWLNERKNNLDKEIKGIEDKILEKDGVLSKKKVKENEKEEISKILESKTNNLNNIKVAESDIKLQENLKSKISEVENKIKEYESDIYDKGQSKYKVDEEIKNKETNERNWEAHVSSARSELSSAETELNTSYNRGSSNSCWGGRSPELSSSCIQRYRKKVEEKKNTKESYEKILNTARGELKGEKEKSKKLSEAITSLNTKKNEEIAKKNQYTKEKQEVEAKIQGVLDQQKSLETDIEKQKAEQIKINEVLLSLEDSTKDLDSSAYEKQKVVLEQKFQMMDSLEQKVVEYQNLDRTEEYQQHQEL
jgi:hypothetical protein